MFTYNLYLTAFTAFRRTLFNLCFFLYSKSGWGAHSKLFHANKVRAFLPSVVWVKHCVTSVYVYMSVFWRWLYFYLFLTLQLSVLLLRYVRSKISMFIFATNSKVCIEMAISLRFHEHIYKNHVRISKIFGFRYSLYSFTLHTTTCWRLTIVARYINKR